MHELGIIVHVMRTVEDVAAENNLTEIRSVTCEIGRSQRRCPGIHDRLLGLCKKQIRAFKRLRIKNRDHTWCYHV